ncbi:MAG: orotate phosphoribosyltransferase [Bryobacteraceae bacterium]
MASQADPVLALFEDAGAYLKGHFRLTSGLHSAEYLQSALVLRHPRRAEELGRRLASDLKNLTSPREIGLVVAPALGGLIIGHEVARALNTPFLFTERDASGQMSLRRGFSVAPGATAVVAEDVITTGGSTREVIEILTNLGGSVLAAGSIVDRSGGTAALGLPRAALVTLNVISYPPEICPMCREGIPISKPGSRNAG